MDIKAFLSTYPPFDSLDEAALAEVAGRIRIEFFPSSATILERSGDPARFLYVVRNGAVELLDDGRLVDLLGPGEVFGHPSLLSGLGPSLDVRAAEDTLCYLIDREDAERILRSSPGLTFLSRSLRQRTVRALEGWESERADPWRGEVRRLLKRPPVTCSPTDAVADAARVMAGERISSLLIPLEANGFGILTDRDLRARVLAEGRSGDTAVADVMSHPVVTVEPDAMLAEVLMVMLERGVHHLPVVDRAGNALGVVTDTDLMGLERQTPFQTKSAIERAGSRAEAVAAGRRLHETVRELVDAAVDPVDVGHVVAVTVDALTRRLMDLAIGSLGEPPVPWAWLSLGSQARHEQALATDQDHALAYDPQAERVEDVDAYFAQSAEYVTAGLESAGIPRCKAGVTAAGRTWRGSVDEWVGRFLGWMTDVSAEGSMFTAIAFDYRRVCGPLAVEGNLDAVVRSAPNHPVFLRHLARNAVASRPPTGFRRDLVVQADGEHAGTLDVKHGGITLVTSLARVHALAAGSTEIRTLRRLRDATAAGRIDEESRAGLEESFRLLWQIRLEHQSGLAEAGRAADDFVDPASLGPVTRQGLKESFRVIDREQRSLASEHGLRRR